MFDNPLPISEVLYRQHQERFNPQLPPHLREAVAQANQPHPSAMQPPNSWRITDQAGSNASVAVRELLGGRKPQEPTLIEQLLALPINHDRDELISQFTELTNRIVMYLNSQKNAHRVELVARREGLWKLCREGEDALKSAELLLGQARVDVRMADERVFEIRGRLTQAKLDPAGGGTRFPTEGEVRSWQQKIDQIQSELDSGKISQSQYTEEFSKAGERYRQAKARLEYLIGQLELIDLELANRPAPGQYGLIPEPAPAIIENIPPQPREFILHGPPKAE